MNDNEKYIEEFVNDIPFDAPDGKHRDTLKKQLLSAFPKHRLQPTVRTVGVWRTIMKSRITKLAAAVVIIIAVLIGINQFGVPIDGTSATFAAMIENAEQMPWIHMTVVTKRAYGDQQKEYWISFKSQMAAEKYDDNRLCFYNGLEHKSYLYEPLEDKIFVSYSGYRRSRYNSPIEMMKLYTDHLERDAVNISTENKLIDGIKAQVITARIPEGDNTANITLIRNVDQNLLTSIEVQLSSKTIITTYDYPEKGPEDIYSIGAPTDVEIVHLAAPPELKQLKEKIKVLKGASHKPYVAITVSCDSTQLPTSFTGQSNSVISIWQNNDAWRCDIGYYAENTDISRTPETLPDDIQYSAELLTPAISYIVTGGKTYSLIRKEWGDGKIHKRTAIAYPGNISIEETCWPRMRGTDGIPVNWKVESITDPNGESLILVERTQDGRVPNEKGVYVKPTRQRWFFNPERDYICQRREKSVLLYADWVTNKEWLREENSPRFEWAARDYEEIVEVIEYAQTSSGRWYPRVIKETALWYNDNVNGEATVDQKSSYSTCRKIYLEENPDFPAGIFDPETLLD